MIAIVWTFPAILIAPQAFFQFGYQSFNDSNMLLHYWENTDYQVRCMLHYDPPLADNLSRRLVKFLKFIVKQKRFFKPQKWQACRIPPCIGIFDFGLW